MAKFFQKGRDKAKINRKILVLILLSSIMFVTVAITDKIGPEAMKYAIHIYGAFCLVLLFIGFLNHWYE